MADIESYEELANEVDRGNITNDEALKALRQQLNSVEEQKLQQQILDTVVNHYDDIQREVTALEEEMTAPQQGEMGEERLADIRKKLTDLRTRLHSEIEHMADFIHDPKERTIDVIPEKKLTEIQAGLNKAVKDLDALFHAAGLTPDRDMLKDEMMMQDPLWRSVSANMEVFERETKQRLETMAKDSLKYKYNNPNPNPEELAQEVRWILDNMPQAEKEALNKEIRAIANKEAPIMEQEEKQPGKEVTETGVKEVTETDILARAEKLFQQFRSEWVGEMANFDEKKARETARRRAEHELGVNKEEKAASAEELAQSRTAFVMEYIDREFNKLHPGRGDEPLTDDEKVERIKLRDEAFAAWDKMQEKERPAAGTAAAADKGKEQAAAALTSEQEESELGQQARARARAEGGFDGLSKADKDAKIAGYYKQLLNERLHGQNEQEPPLRPLAPEVEKAIKEQIAKQLQTVPGFSNLPEKERGAMFDQLYASAREEAMAKGAQVAQQKEPNPKSQRSGLMKALCVGVKIAKSALGKFSKTGVTVVAGGFTGMMVGKIPFVGTFLAPFAAAKVGSAINKVVMNRKLDKIWEDYAKAEVAAGRKPNKGDMNNPESEFYKKFIDREEPVTKKVRNPETGEIEEVPDIDPKTGKQKTKHVGFKVNMEKADRMSKTMAMVSGGLAAIQTNPVLGPMLAPIIAGLGAAAKVGFTVAAVAGGYKEGQQFAQQEGVESKAGQMIAGAVNGIVSGGVVLLAQILGGAVVASVSGAIQAAQNGEDVDMDSVMDQFKQSVSDAFNQLANIPTVLRNALNGILSMVGIPPIEQTAEQAAPVAPDTTSQTPRSVGKGWAGLEDRDGDGIPDFLDGDRDGDGVPDSIDKDGGEGWANEPPASEQTGAGDNPPAPVEEEVPHNVVSEHVDKNGMPYRVVEGKAGDGYFDENGWHKGADGVIEKASMGEIKYNADNYNAQLKAAGLGQQETGGQIEAVDDIPRELPEIIEQAKETATSTEGYKLLGRNNKANDEIFARIDDKKGVTELWVDKDGNRRIDAGETLTTTRTPEEVAADMVSLGGWEAGTGEQAGFEAYKAGLESAAEELDSISKIEGTTYTEEQIKANVAATGQAGVEVGDEIVTTNKNGTTSTETVIEVREDGLYSTTATDRNINGRDVTVAEWKAHQLGLDARIKVSDQLTEEYHESLQHEGRAFNREVVTVDGHSVTDKTAFNVMRGTLAARLPGAKLIGVDTENATVRIQLPDGKFISSGVQFHGGGDGVHNFGDKDATFSPELERYIAQQGDGGKEL